MLVLENSAGSGWGLGADLDELAAIADAVDGEGVPRHRLGFCLDTAHAWGAGLDVGDPATIDAFLGGFDERIGLDRLVMIHLNDSRSERGSRLDRHEHLGAGRIGPVGLGHLLRHPAAGPRRGHPGDAGHGRGLRRDQPRPGARPRRGRAARRPARRGVHAAQRPGPDGAGVTPTRPDRARARRPRARLRSRGSRSSGSLALAALLRLPDLATRGTWDGDQGHDMLVLRAFVRDGVVPLLGPPTSIGDVHHGAWYYYLLSPGAFLTGGDSPLAVVATIAVAGIAAVGVAWWLGRSIGGPWAGVLAGLVLAVSTRRRRRVDVHLEPEPHRPVERRSPWPARGWPGAAARRGGGSSRPSAWPSRCSATSWASRSCPIVAVPLVLDARRRPLGRAVSLGHRRRDRRRLPAARSSTS